MFSLSHRGNPGKGAAARGPEDIGAQPHPNRLDTLDVCLGARVCVCELLLTRVCVNRRDFTINHILCDFACVFVSPGMS